MKKPIILITLLVFMFLLGCGTTKAVKLQPVAGEVDFSKYRTLTLTLSVADGAEMVNVKDDDLTETRKYIIEALNKYYSKFQIIDDGRDNTGLVLEIRFTKFIGIGPFTGPKIEAEVSVKSPNGLIATGIVKVTGLSTLYGGDVSYWDGARFLFGGVGPNRMMKEKFAEKLAKSL
jgi:hypothetical protein